jgi:hypothetical protein
LGRAGTAIFGKTIIPETWIPASRKTSYDLVMQNVPPGRAIDQKWPSPAERFLSKGYRCAGIGLRLFRATGGLLWRCAW